MNHTEKSKENIHDARMIRGGSANADGGVCERVSVCVSVSGIQIKKLAHQLSQSIEIVIFFVAITRSAALAMANKENPSPMAWWLG